MITDSSLAKEKAGKIILCNTVPNRPAAVGSATRNSVVNAMGKRIDEFA